MLRHFEFDKLSSGDIAEPDHKEEIRATRTVLDERQGGLRCHGGVDVLHCCHECHLDVSVRCAV